MHRISLREGTPRWDLLEDGAFTIAKPYPKGCPGFTGTALESDRKADPFWNDARWAAWLTKFLQFARQKN